MEISLSGQRAFTVETYFEESQGFSHCEFRVCLQGVCVQHMHV